MNISSLKPNEKNPRLIKDDKFEKLCQSIKRNSSFLNLRPIIYDKDMIVVAGNMRYRALLHLGFSEIPDEWTRSAENLSTEELREFLIVDNVSYGEWNWDILSTEYDLTELENWGVDVPDFVSAEEVIQDEFDATLPETPITQAGDIYELNQHRFQCGDSTNAEVVERTLNGASPILMITDPPYGVKYDPTWRHKAGVNKSTRQGAVENDDRIDWTEAYQLFSGDIAYVWHGGKNSPEVASNIIQAGFEIVSQIIWNKQRMVLSRGDYHWKHEPCWYAVRKGAKHSWNGGRAETTVWDIDNLLSAKDDDSKQIHGTQKPVECMARPIRNNSYERQSVYDPFLGSGTTIIAAEQLNRACYGQEIDPAYCDVIVRRWVKFMIENGRTFSVLRNSEDESATWTSLVNEPHVGAETG